MYNYFIIQIFMDHGHSKTYIIIYYLHIFNQFLSSWLFLQPSTSLASHDFLALWVPEMVGPLGPGAGRRSLIERNTKVLMGFNGI